MECPFLFTDIDEALMCVEKGIERQVSEDRPILTRTIERQRATGEIYREEEETSNFSVVLQAYPTSVLPSQYKPEMEMDMPTFNREYTFPGQVPKDPKVRSWSRYAFNFALPVAWREDLNNTGFSFAKQFPECALWLTYPAKSCHWMSLERGVLCAIKGKNHCQGANNVVHKTLKHDTLHALIADMEEQIVLPVSWKYKHRK